MSIRVAVREEIKLINVSRSSTLAMVIDVIKKKFKHEDLTGWAVFKLNVPLSEKAYSEMRRENSKAFTTNATRLDEDIVPGDVLEFPTSNQLVTLVAEPSGEYPNSLRIENH